MERDEAPVIDDLGQTPTPIDTANPSIGTDPQPGETGPDRAAATPSSPQPEVASAPSSREGDQVTDRSSAPVADPGGVAGPGGNDAPGQGIPPGSAAQEAGRAGEDLLLPADQRRSFIAQWSDIQAHFVDQPRQSVEQADALVVDIMQRVSAGFSHERERLEGQWEQGDEVSTEDLRVALTRYRSFFDRLIST